ncbi:DUF2202 domain-containing protein [uncultured Draconibacterium sp.]|uniref:DUF2202 domain-containing protein n=1 Tax=uncultured Draconibacterium sp. TaxID=1573823 RepID=UPI0029C73267|nr:DUF2202 domain-containing protein [uncultured Draconibacterium sp.]
MNRLRTFLFTMLAGLAITFTACSENDSADEAINFEDKSVEFYATLGDSITFDNEVTAADSAGLLLMREEEILARDVYLYFYEMYGQNIFGNIASSEDRHASSVLYLLDGYGIEDPATGVTGEFTNEVLGDLYVALTEQGSESLAAALAVGATIEDLDISDLKLQLANTENADIIRVYENLLQGSENHMRGFVRNLEALGETYTPQYITEEEYDAILAGTNGQGYGKGGNGYGNGGRGNGQGGYRYGQNR